NQQGAIADYLDVETGFERAVEACLGDLLQHVVVERPEHAAAGFQLVRDASAGRCGFLVTSMVQANGTAEAGHYVPATEPQDIASRYVVSAFGRTLPDAPSDLRTLSSLVTVKGPYASAIRHAIGDAWIAPSYARAAELSATTALAIATV